MLSLAAHDAQPDARVPQRALHLRVRVPPALPLHALGQVYPGLSGTWVSGFFLRVYPWAGPFLLELEQEWTGRSLSPSSLFLWPGLLVKYSWWTGSKGTTLVAKAAVFLRPLLCLLHVPWTWC